jgi:hypothetical protein
MLVFWRNAAYRVVSMEVAASIFRGFSVKVVVTSNPINTA